MLNKRLVLALSAVVNSFNCIQENDYYTERQLEILAKRLVEDHKVDVDKIDRAAAISALAEYDIARGAWIAEDNYSSDGEDPRVSEAPGL